MRWPVASVVAAALALSAGSPAVASEAADEAERCDVSSWSMSWGVKESFRAYLSGSIAKGEWLVDGDVSYSTPEFTVVGSQGWLDPDGESGELIADGSIRFVGHGGILDQTLSAPMVRFNEDTLTLVFDVSGDTQEGTSVNSLGVAFATADLTAEVDKSSGLWRVVQAPTVLTAEGAEAFGTYPAGEAFDPVSIEAAVEPGCLTSPGLFARPVAWVVSATLLAGAAAVAVTVRVRRSRGPERPTPQES